MSSALNLALLQRALFLRKLDEVVITLTPDHCHISVSIPGQAVGKAPDAMRGATGGTHTVYAGRSVQHCAGANVDEQLQAAARLVSPLLEEPKQKEKKP